MDLMNALQHQVQIISKKLPTLPELPPPSLLQVAGLGSREIYNTRLLAYFFNPDEKHGLGNLFKECLLHCAVQNPESFSGSQFLVNAEVQTRYAKINSLFIDLTLESADWIIFIENKIFHHVHNNLQVYYEHCASSNKSVLPIVLSLNSIAVTSVIHKENKVPILNVTHLELLEEVSNKIFKIRNLPDHTLFQFREYYRTMSAFYPDPAIDEPMNQTIHTIIQNKEKIDTIYTKIAEAKNWLLAQMDKMLAQEFGCEKVKQWYRVPEFRYNTYFWINHEAIYNNELIIFFEVRNHVNKSIDREAFQSYFIKEYKDCKHFSQESMGSHPDTQTHACCYYQTNFIVPGEDMIAKIKEIFESFFFAVQDGIVCKAHAYLEKNYPVLVAKQEQE